MLERDGYPPGVPCWVDTSQPNPGAAVAFYRGVFGWGSWNARPKEHLGSTTPPRSGAATLPRLDLR